MHLTWLSLVCFLYTTQAMRAPSYSRDGLPAVLNWTQDLINSAKASFKDPRYPSPEYWSKEIVYSIVVDRFRNGDPSNDNVNLPPFQRDEQKTGNLYNVASYRHGGDLQGIIDRLDYLSYLGISSLWITPVFYNDAGSFHGYCLSDPSQIDPGFGTRDTLKTLVSEAHKRGIRVVLDIVINHICDAATGYSAPSSNHEGCAADLYSNTWTGQPGGSQYQGTLRFSDQFFPPFDSQFFFSRCGANSPGDTSGEGPAAVFGDFVPIMFDLDTRNYDFQKIFTEIHKYWIAYTDIDGYRLDAAKHVTEDFLAYFSTEIRDFAAFELGKKNFYVVGEVAADINWEARRLGFMLTDPHNPANHGNIPQTLVSRIQYLQSTFLRNPTFQRPGLTGIYDFYMSGTSKDVLKGIKSPSAIATYLQTDFNLVNNQSDLRQSWYLLEIHDWPRFLRYDPNNQALLAVGLSYLLLLHGQPIIYYGVEQGFNGNCNYDAMYVGNARPQVSDVCNAAEIDSNARQCMFLEGGWKQKSCLPQIDKFASINYPNTPAPGYYNWTKDPFCATDHNIFKVVRRFSHLRRSCNALSYGFIYPRRMDTNQMGIISFSRIDKGSEFVVIVNPSDQQAYVDEILVDHNLNQPGTVFKDLLSSGPVTGYVKNEGSSVVLSISRNLPPKSTAVYARADQPYRWSPDLETYLCI